jgi:hypothetical protein
VALADTVWEGRGAKVHRAAGELAPAAAGDGADCADRARPVADRSRPGPLLVVART